MPSFSCLRGIETRGEANDNHKSSFSVFHLLFLLEGAKIRGENNNDLCDHCHPLFFTRMTTMRK
jgi:hypothetical protein